MRCDYAHDDGAYVLGALSPAERSAYERHLATCAACREAVAEIAVLPGLLGRLDSATALQLLTADDPEQASGAHGASGASRRHDGRPVGGARGWPASARENADDARVTTLLNAAARDRRKERRGRRLRYATAALAAAGVAFLAMIGVGVLRDDLGGETGGETVQMQAMVPASQELPVTASVGLETRGWGTEVTMSCAYRETERYRNSWVVHLMAYGPDNEAEQVGSWIAAPGKEITFTGVTRFTGQELERLALTRADGTQLLTYNAR